MLGTDQFNFGRVSGKIGLTMKLWQDRRSVSVLANEAHIRFSFQILACTDELFLLNVVAECVSKESKVTKEERIAQVIAKLIEYHLVVGCNASH